VHPRKIETEGDDLSECPGTLRDVKPLQTNLENGLMDEKGKWSRKSNKPNTSTGLVPSTSQLNYGCNAERKPV
jgi:hypothetical protein